MRDEVKRRIVDEMADTQTDPTSAPVAAASVGDMRTVTNPKATAVMPRVDKDTVEAKGEAGEMLENMSEAGRADVINTNRVDRIYNAVMKIFRGSDSSLAGRSIGRKTELNTRFILGERMDGDHIEDDRTSGGPDRWAGNPSDVENFCP